MTENKYYLTDQLITYLGNKRKLLDFINSAIIQIKKEQNKEKLTFLDGFSGSGIISRLFKQHASEIYTNDLELYSYIINLCYLSNKDNIPATEINSHIKKINSIKLNKNSGIIQDLYAPKDDKNIQQNERCFFTTKNALIIDNAIQYIHKLDNNIKHFILAPLLSEISIHANTSGVFKGFYKNSKTNLGQFGGDGKNALKRILGEIEINFPVLSNYVCDYNVFNCDINKLIKDLPKVDVAYYDPPYNQHPYGSNYFMLNIACQNKKPDDISNISGIPKNWNKSVYNNKDAKLFLEHLIENTKANNILLSYNDEGIIKINEISEILNKFGKLFILEKDYNVFRGSRNLNNRNTKLKEYLFWVKKWNH